MRGRPVVTSVRRRRPDWLPGLAIVGLAVGAAVAGWFYGRHAAAYFYEPPLSTNPTTTLGGETMLVLSRRMNETLVIGDSIRITVLGISGNQVRLGIEAPKDIPVHREEVADRIAAEQQLAAAG